MQQNDVWKRSRKRRKIIIDIVQQLVRLQQQRTLLASQLIRMEEERTSTNVKWGGRKLGSKNYKRGKSNWEKDYLGNNPTYPSKVFRRRFAIPRTMYERLKKDLLEFNEEEWGNRRNGIGKKGIPTDVKMLAALRILSTGDPFDSLDDVAYMAEQSVSDYFKLFCNDVMSIYGKMFLNRRPNEGELEAIVEQFEEMGVPGCMGSIDCMKIKWKNCPYYEKGQMLNTNESNLATIRCEAWCDHDLYCWHWYPGRSGTNNDITIVSRSPLFRDVFNDYFNVRSKRGYKIIPEGKIRRLYYFLVDGIYPNWPLFAKPIHQPVNEEEGKYSSFQEGVRKDIERLFGILQIRFAIMRREFLGWDINEILKITNVCVILHNMMVRMNQNGDLTEEMGEDDAVTEIMDMEQEMSEQSWIEYNENVVLVQESREEQLEAEGERLIMKEYFLTNVYEHESLKEELIKKVNST